MIRRRMAVAGLLLATLAVTEGGSVAEDAAWVATQPVQTHAQHRLAALPDGTVWAVVDHNRVLLSTDAGQTWLPRNPVPVQSQAAPIPLSGPMHGGSSDTMVAPRSAKVAFGANGAALSQTTDGGLTWLPLPAPSVTRSKFFEYATATEYDGGRLHYARSGSEVRDGCPYPLPSTPVFSSPDGHTWQRGDIALRGGRVNEIRFLNDRQGVALVSEFRYTDIERSSDGTCGYSGISDTTSVQVTSDGGRSWRHVFRCKPICFGVSWSTPHRLALGRWDRRVFVSTDEGRRFGQAASMPAPPADAISFLQALDCVGARCWASVNGGGIFRSDGGEEWIREASGQEAFGLQIGDLAAVDRSHAVSGGPHALVTRTTAPTELAGPELRSRLHTPSPTRFGGGLLHRDGSITVQVALRLSGAR